MKTANELMLDSMLRHEVGVRRLSTGIVRKIIAEIQSAIPDLERQIRNRMAWIAQRGFDTSDFTLRRLEANLQSLKATLHEAYVAVGKELRSELHGLAKYETEFQQRALLSSIKTAIGVEVGVSAPSLDMLKAIVTSRPFQGGLLKDWGRQLEANAFKAIRGSIRQGLLQQESIDQIVRRTFGKATRIDGQWVRTGGGFQQVTREAQSVVRTAVSHVANEARDATWRANSELIKGLSWIATLDDKTCEICAPRDGLVYDLETHEPIGHSVPWGAGPGRMHFGDRCTSTVILKSWKDLGIDRDDIAPGNRAAMDGTKVRSDMTFGQWLEGAGADVQNEVLGAKRAAAFRAGQVKFGDLFDDKGRWLTLDKLKIMEAGR